MAGARGLQDRPGPRADLVRNLEQVRSRRKAVIYFSQGYDFNPFEDERIIQPNAAGAAAVLTRRP